MNIALLGFGNYGRQVYDILSEKKTEIFRNYDINIKYILVKNTSNRGINPELLTDSYDKIVSDSDLDLVIDMTGSDESFDYIKRALTSKKHVITSNAMVVANHYVELQAIAIDMQVKFLFSATIGSGLPIVNTLLKIHKYSNISKVEAILDGSINNILSSMSKDNMSFSQAKEKEELKLGYPIDFSALQQSYELAVLMMLSFDTIANADEIYRQKIENIPDDANLIASLLGYRIKYLAFAKLHDMGLDASIEQVLVKTTDIIANTDYDYGVIKYYDRSFESEAMYGRTNGKFVVNGIISDILIVLSDYRQKFMPKYAYMCFGIRHMQAKYLIKVKIMNDYFRSITEKNLDNYIITNTINGSELIKHLSEIEFYARFLD